jgi:Tol biopolymer transport system component
VVVRDLQAGVTAQIADFSSMRSSFQPGRAISGDGRFVVFSSGETNFVSTPDTNSAVDVFVRDLQMRTTTLVSTNSSGTATGNAGSRDAIISADGRFVAFSSTAGDLVPNDANGQSDVFIRDLQTGTTTLASANRLGTDSGNGASTSPVLSDDGRFVTFSSSASDLVENDTNGQEDIFVRDLQTGKTTLVSVNRAGTNSGNATSSAPVISANGNFVAFSSAANDLVTTDTNGQSDVFVRPVN